MGEMIEANKLDQVLSEYSYDKIEALPTFQRALTLAKGIGQCLQLIEPHMKDLMELKGTKLGFLTDKEYDKQTVKTILVEGMLRGAMPTGNEINVIGGNLYLTKEYFTRRLSEMPGLTNLRVDIGTPQVLREPRWEKTDNGKNRSVPGAALVEISASWKTSGIPQSLQCRKSEDGDTRIPIRLDPFYSIDQILGKAESKLLRRVYKRITGSSWVQEDEDDEIEALPSEGQERLPEPEATSDLAEFEKAIRNKFGKLDKEGLGKEASRLLKANKDSEAQYQIVTQAAMDREDELAGDTSDHGE
jgi:hypothetical protein